MAKYNENVLCVPRSIFDQRSFNGFIPAVSNSDIGFYLGSPDGTQPAPCVFIDRNQVDGDGETTKGDESYKQIIPYVVFLMGRDVFIFDRAPSSNETRLHGKSSIGIGGHITDQDDTEPFWAYLKGMIREITEETGLQIDHDGAKKTVIGLVNNDADEVGRLHLGFVHVIQVNPQQAQKIIEQSAENEVINPRFVPVESFVDAEVRESLESWSAFIIKKLMDDLSIAQEKKFDMAKKERAAFISMIASRACSMVPALLIQETPEEADPYYSDIEEFFGQLYIIQAMMIERGDIRDEAIKKHAEGFMQLLPSIAKHQDFNPIENAG